MNLPNKLTVLRVIMVPVFLVFLLIPSIPGNYFWALGIFAAASITDWLDGHIARKRHLVTNFGKFLDPLADKVLVISALICFVKLGIAGAVPVILIVAREFMVSGLRMVAASEENVVIAAGIWGKLKTAFTMIAIVAILLLQGLTKSSLVSAVVTEVAGTVLIWISTALTVISGIQYLWAYRKVIDPSK